jgi:hypothetical protein
MHPRAGIEWYKYWLVYVAINIGAYEEFMRSKPCEIFCVFRFSYYIDKLLKNYSRKYRRCTRRHTRVSPGIEVLPSLTNKCVTRHSWKTREKRPEAPVKN